MRGGGVEVSKNDHDKNICNHNHVEEFGCEQCAKKVTENIGGQFSKQRPLLVGCAGGTASGKTSICEM